MPKPKPTALEEWATSKEASENARSAKELAYWRTWNANGRKPEHLEPLLKLYDPFIGRKTVEISRGAAQVTPEAARGSVTKHVIRGFESYDPTRGAALMTHVYTSAQKSLRDVRSWQNIAYIPEGKVQRIGDIQRAVASIEEEGGVVSDHAVSEWITQQQLKPLTPKQIKNIRSRQIKDVRASAFESDPIPALTSRQREVLPLLGPTLSPKAKAVFDLCYHETNPVTGTNELARRLGTSPSDISRRKAEIEQELLKYQ